MSAQLHILGQTRLIDTNGIADGAEIYFFLTGTLTPATTYTTSAMNVAHPHPIVVNAGAAVPNIYLDNAVTYRRRIVYLDGSVDDTDPYTGLGASGIAYQNALGTRARSQDDLNQEILSLEDFCAMDGSAETANFQAFVDACSSDTIGGAPQGRMPRGQIKITGTIRFKHTYVNIVGAGRFATEILCNGVAGSVLKADAIAAFKPKLKGFALVGNGSTGIGIDLGSVSGDIFDHELSDLYIYTGGDGIYARSMFSGALRDIDSTSLSGHSLRIGFGPSIDASNLYAKQAGPGKAGYRLAGEVTLINCNGVDTADYWGVFGQDTTRSDGFQHDFPDGSGGWITDYAHVLLIGCNIEAFDVCGVRLHGAYRNFDVHGGKIERDDRSTAYHSLIHLTAGPVVSGNPLDLDFGRVLPGSGVPNGGAALTTAWVYASAGQPIVIDRSGAFANVSITGVYTTVYAGLVPLVRMKATNDVYQDSAIHFSALAARRISASVIRYDTPAALTPVGADQTIDVTGYTKVTVTPAAGASISHATFTQTIGAGLDNARNGDLIIEAGNGNLTLKHNAAGEGGFRLAAAGDLALASGAIARFCWSANYTAGVAGWVQA